MEYASKGVAGAALGTGIAGLSLGVLNGAGGLFNMMGGGCGNGYAAAMAYEDRNATKYDMNLALAIAQKDSEIAMLRSEQNTEIKIADVYERLATKINAVEKAQADINREQAVYNGVNTTMIGGLRNQVDELMHMTRRYIPKWNIVPEPMDRYNTWVAPTTSTTQVAPEQTT